jgi:cell division protein FtsB
MNSPADCKLLLPENGNEDSKMKAIISILLLVLVLLQWRLWVGDGGVQELTQLEQELAAQKAENEALQQRNQMLESEILDLKNGVEAVEERARSDLGMIREGETFYMVID